MDRVSSRWATQEYEITGGHALLPKGHTDVAKAIADGICVRYGDPVVSVTRADSPSSWDDPVTAHTRVVVTTVSGRLAALCDALHSTNCCSFVAFPALLLACSQGQRLSATPCVARFLWGY
jgi:hypothetical protein